MYGISSAPLPAQALSTFSNTSKCSSTKFHNRALNNVLLLSLLHELKCVWEADDANTSVDRLYYICHNDGSSDHFVSTNLFVNKTTCVLRSKAVGLARLASADAKRWHSNLDVQFSIDLKEYKRNRRKACKRF